LARAMEVLRSRLAHPPEMRALAKLCGLSMVRFARLVHRVFHLTPRQLAMKMRIDEALHLLLTTDRPLCDLALETGFCDQSAFTRHFRRMTGVPPGVFRGTRSQERGAVSQEPGTKSQVGRGETASDSFAASD